MHHKLFIRDLDLKYFFNLWEHLGTAGANILDSEQTLGRNF